MRCNMKHVDILETEYKEQYSQYRWIGQMQSHVLTFYGVVVAFSFAAIAAFRQLPSTQIDYRLPAVITIMLGLLGLLVGYGLFRSRTMQRRTAKYLGAIINQMLNSAEDNVPLKESALRYRSLCSTKGHFKFLDTMNIVILIALYSGETFFLGGILALMVIFGLIYLHNAVLIGVVLLGFLFFITPFIVLRFIMDKETKRMEEEYRIANNIESNKIEQLF